ncbi:MAG: hypothetical protein P4L10_05725 [Acidobacteriaceae bacterium]|nr:hypothetical protein [Acidobacteriaceae bacterium]
MRAEARTYLRGKSKDNGKGNSKGKSKDKGNNGRRCATMSHTSRDETA